MFHLLLTTCFAGILCYASEPDVSYISAERCLQQGAIISGLARVNLGLSRLQQSSKIVCSAVDGTNTTIFIGRENAVLQDFPVDAMTLPVLD
jgi:hypothetical protein